MASRSRVHQQRLSSHSRSTPNFATIKEELPPLPPWGTSPRSKQSRDTPLQKRKNPTFTPGAPSEPVSADEKDDDSSSAHSGSSFERDLLSRTTSYSESAYSSEEEAEDAESGATSNRRRSPQWSSASGTTTPGLRPPYTRSQSSLGPSAFAPPFYNRPPTPLPPSPSLTSLLRPRPFTSAFSPSRPTTPDSSDTEATGATSAFSGVRNTYSTTSLARASTITSATPSTAGIVAQSALTSTGPVPSASPKLPTNEYYGFVLYLGSSLAFFLYLLWSYLPTPFLHQLGIYYYPDRWWSLAVPSWLVMALVWTYVALASYNTGYLTLPLKSLECLVDEKGRLAVVDERGKIVRERKGVWDMGQGRAAGKQRRKREKREKEKRRERELGEQKMREMDLDWRVLWSEGTDAVMDVPIGGVCEVLYGAGRDGVSGEEMDVGEGIENG